MKYLLWFLVLSILNEIQSYKKCVIRASYAQNIVGNPQRTRPAEGCQGQIEMRGLRASFGDNLNLDSLISIESLDDVKKLMEGEKVFKVHSVVAGLFGTILLLFPDLLLGSGPVAAFAYQQWSLFILTVSFITNAATELKDDKAKEILATAIFAMCAGETALYTKEILSTFGRIPFFVYMIDFSSLFVFAFLAYGYYSSGLTSFSASSDD